MKGVGITAEYNPFHKGHQYHIAETRRLTGADCVTVVMSGDFLQRGEAAMYNKWARAKMAVLGGADLVVELPAPFASNSAEFFAWGAISILEGLGGIEAVSFGCETDELDYLQQAGEILEEEPAQWKKSLVKYLDQGLPFARARWKATEAYLKQWGLDDERRRGILQTISQPNGILAVEYIKQLKRKESAMRPVAVKRLGSGYHQDRLSGGLPSAKGIRQAMKQGTEASRLTEYLPFETVEVIQAYLQKAKTVETQDFFPLMRYELIKSPQEDLKEIFSAGEGIENRAARAAVGAEDYAALVEEIKTKRYALTSVQRFLLHVLLGLRTSDMTAFQKEESLYLRVLAVNDRGRAFLRCLKKENRLRLPLVVDCGRALKQKDLSPGAKALLAFDIRAAALYEMAASQKALAKELDFYKHPFVYEGKPAL